MFPVHLILHLISKPFLTRCYTRGTQTHIYYIWFVLFPLVKFCTSLQDRSLNEIGYGNVERCRPVVSADVVELGSMENGTNSSERQALTHRDTSVQADSKTQTHDHAVSG